MKYIPKTGAGAGKRNFERVKKYWIKNPDATGVEISKALNLSLVTVYNHLKKIR